MQHSETAGDSMQQQSQSSKGASTSYTIFSIALAGVGCLAGGFVASLFTKSAGPIAKAAAYGAAAGIGSAFTLSFANRRAESAAELQR